MELFRIAVLSLPDAYEPLQQQRETLSWFEYAIFYMYDTDGTKLTFVDNCT